MMPGNDRPNGLREEESQVARVAIFTDSASDLDPAEAAASGIHVIPLIVNFGDASFRAGVDMSGPEFWARMTAPDAPFPTTAASSPGDFRDAYEAAFAEGAEAIVAIHVAETLSGAIKSARIARDMLPDREIHIVDSLSASMAIGLIARMGLELAEADVPASEIAHELEERALDLRIYFALETLEYLKKGGRISGTQAAIGTLLSVKPVIMVKHGEVTTVDKVRTRSKARDRVIELTIEKPVERLAILHSETPDIDAFRAELLKHLPDIDPNAVSVEIVGASVGPHVGPGCVGAAILYRPS
jgi:fatty acid kinase fatty acid binding subunit